METSTPQKLYAYVDESGQDTLGEFFLVSVVVTGEAREGLRTKLRTIERASGKQAKKWRKARLTERVAYLQSVFQLSELRGCIYFARYHATRAYVDLMILSTAKALHAHGAELPQATVIVDGLSRPERPRFAAGLRKLRIRVHKVRGARDQADEFIRLADAVAGGVRDSMEGDAIMRPLFEQAARHGVVREV
jgi:hypothetical protein